MENECVIGVYLRSSAAHAASLTRGLPMDATTLRSRRISIPIFVVFPPPVIGRGLRPSFRRGLPCLLAPKRCKVEQVEIDAQPVDAARVREIRAIHVLAIAEKDAEPVRLPILVRDSEVVVE